MSSFLFETTNKKVSKNSDKFAAQSTLEVSLVSAQQSRTKIGLTLK